MVQLDRLLSTVEELDSSVARTTGDTSAGEDHSVSHQGPEEWIFFISSPGYPEGLLPGVEACQKRETADDDGSGRGGD